VSRADLIYAAPGTAAIHAQGFDPDAPIAGYYRMRLRSGGVFVAIRIWFGQPRDPLTGDLMDRSLRWQATANGNPIDLDRVWPQCAADPIDEAEARHLIKLQRWGQQTGHPALADPTRKLNPLSTPLQF
jgi:hypothetical protein